MNVFITILLLTSCLSKLFFHSPDYISYLDLSTIPLKIGTPALYKIYGNLFFIYSNHCETTYYGSNETFLVFLYPLYCNITDLAIKSYQAGTKLLMFVDDYEGTLAKNVGESINTNIIPNISIITVPNNLCELVCSYPVVLTSYIYDIKKFESPEIKVILSGIHEEDKQLINSFSNFYAKYHSDSINFDFNFLYKSGYQESQDCLNYFNNYYCSWGNSNYTGQEVLRNLIAFQSYYITLPNNQEGLLDFLSYLSAYYSKCFSNYSLSCNLEVLKSFSNVTLSLDIFLAFAIPYTYLRGYFIINYANFPWADSLESAYCLSSYDLNIQCPLCSPNCFYYMLNDLYCHSECNSSLCGYQNIQCLEVKSGCYNFMLYDGICNQACNEGNCSSYPDTDPEPESEPVSVHKFPITEYLPLIIIPSVIFLFFIVFCVVCCIRKYRLWNLNRGYLSGIKNLLKTVKFTKDLDILGDAVCAIDLDEFKENENVVVTPCKHVFHPGCLKEWIERAENVEKNCPICKNPLNELVVPDRV